MSERHSDKDWYGRDVLRTAGSGLRNDLPESGGYQWRPADSAREAEVAAELAAIRARAAQIHAEREAQDDA